MGNRETNGFSGHGPGEHAPGRNDSSDGPTPPMLRALHLGKDNADDTDDAWIDAFREAIEPIPLGMLGSFEILDEISRGGQGIVYRARDERTGNIVALKRLIAGSLASVTARHRFEREIKAARTLDHPCIVNMLGREVIDGQPVLTMEWIAGVSIVEWADGLLGESPAALRAKIDLFRDVCSAVQHAHQRGVIHRDLKPSNILVDTEGMPHVLDFGIAKMFDADQEGFAEGDPRTVLTMTEHFVGTPAFASPEQVRGQRDAIDVRTDVYSLGLILYRMLTREMPYDVSGPIVQTLRAIGEDAPSRPSSVVPEIPRDLEQIVLKALEKEQPRRYQSVEAFSADIERYCVGEPVLAHPPSRVYLFRKLLRRHRVASAFISAIVALVLVFAVVASVLIVRLDTQRRDLIQAESSAVEAGDVAKEVAAFLQDTLASARPSKQGGGQTVLGMLALAAQRAERELTDRPAVAAEVFYAIGYTYRTLWKWREAKPLMERAVEMARRATPRDDELLARCLVAHGTILANLSDEKSVAIHKEALDLIDSLYEGDHALKAEAHMRHGYALIRGLDEPRWEEGEAEFFEALRMFRSVYGPLHREVASCLHNIGYMRLIQGRRAEAVGLYAQGISVFREMGEVEDPYYIELLVGFIPMLLREGRDAEAVALLDEEIPLLREKYGAAYLVWPHRSRGLARLRMGEEEAAVRDLLAAISMFARQQSKGADRAQLGLLRVANDAELALEDPADRSAIGTLARDVEKLQAAGARQLWGMSQELGMALVSADRVDDAAEIFTALQRVAASTERAESLAWSSRFGLIDVAIARGSFVIAEADARAALKEITQWKKTASGAWEAGAQRRLGIVLRELGRFEEAEEMLRRAEAYHRAVPRRKLRNIRVVLRELDVLYSAWGRPDDALGVREEIKALATPTPHALPAVVSGPAPSGKEGK